MVAATLAVPLLVAVETLWHMGGYIVGISRLDLMKQHIKNTFSFETWDIFSGMIKGAVFGKVSLSCYRHEFGRGAQGVGKATKRRRGSKCSNLNHELCFNRDFLCRHDQLKICIKVLEITKY